MFKTQELGNKAGRTIVMLHGWPDNCRDLYTHQIKAFEQNYRLILCDLPGYEVPPRTEDMPYFGYNIAELADMFYATIQYVMKGQQQQKPILMCHDWGVGILNVMYNKYPDTASKIVTLDIGADVEPPHKMSIKAIVMILWYQWTLGFFIFWLPSFIGNPLHRGFSKLLGAPHADISHNNMAYMYLRIWVSRITGSLPKVMSSRPKDAPYKEYANTPVLFMYAQNKPFFFHSQRWVDYLNSGGGGKCVPVPKGGHWFFTKEYLKDDINKEIAAFLEK